jgi:putative peptidoglycan lipid II flippase
MAFGTMTSRVLGQLRESLLAYYFDKRITDACGAAFRLPNLFRRLLGEGSMSVSFIPVFVEARHDSHLRAQNLVNSVYSFLLIILGCLTAFGILYPEALLSLFLDQSYIMDTEKYLLTVRLTKIMFGFIFFISSYAFAMGILNALGQFALPALAPTLLNICMIISTVLPGHYFAVRGDQLAIGILIGGVAQLLLLMPALIKSGYFPRPNFDYRNPDFLKVIKNMGPGLVGTGLLQFTTIINLRFSSSLHEGTISYLNYVDRLVELPLSLVSVSLGTALLPALSGFLTRKETLKFSQTARQYLELNLMLTMAAAAGLYVLAQPVVHLLFGRGHFLPADVEATAEILKTYCWIMIFSSGVRVLTPAYFAVKNTWFPAVVSGICLLVHLFLAPRLMEHFEVRGLMMSTITSATLNLILLLIFFRKFVAVFEYFKFLKNILIYIGLAILTGITANVFFVFENYLPRGTLFLLLNIFASIGLAVSAFVFIGHAFKVEAVSDVVNKVRSRIIRK